MYNWLKLLLILLICSLVIGPLSGISFGLENAKIYLNDIIVLLMVITCLINWKTLKKTIKNEYLFKPYAIFIAVGFISWLISPIQMDFSQRLVSILYLIRFSAYYFVYLSVRILIKNKQITADWLHDRMILGGLVFAFLGWLQYFFYFDLRNLYYLGWDPHYKRIFGTYFDPNFLGIMLLFLLILIFFRQGKNIREWLKDVFVFVTLVFTYSRSTYAALIFALIFYFLKIKKVLFAGLFLAIFAFSIFIIPKPGGNLGMRLDRLITVDARITDWQRGLIIFSHYPVLGAGFNTLRYARAQFNFLDEKSYDIHSGAGVDNSFIFILATTGLTGLVSYLLFLKKIFQKGDLLIKTSLLAAVIHAFFMNTLFFSWVMIWLWMIIGAGQVREYKKL